LSRPCHSAREGQAIIEFIVALISVVVLAAGCLQLAVLTRTHTDLMEEARAEAGEKAMSLQSMAVSPDYILDRTEGSDLKRYSADDEFTTASQSAFQSIIVSKAANNPTGWSLMNQAPNTALPDLRQTWSPVSAFGLVRGSAQQSVPLLSATQHMIYGQGEIEVKCTVWMTWMKGIY
jgi:hypothetical protein